MTPDSEIQDILGRYRLCMNEIKSRTNVIDRFLRGKTTTGYQLTDTESIALQFRKIFELIALASLVAHKDEYSKQRQSFATDWNVNAIIKLISKINPHFYPIPTRQIHDSSGKVVRTENLSEGFLTFDDFTAAINICGDMLHSDNPFSTPKDALKIYKQFPQMLSKTIKLLSHHQVQLYDTNYQIWCLMNGISADKKLNGQVQVSLFKLIGPE